MSPSNFTNKFFFNLSSLKKNFREDVLGHVLDKPRKFQPDWSSQFGGYRYQRTIFAIPQAPLPGPSALNMNRIELVSKNT